MINFQTTLRKLKTPAKTAKIITHIINEYRGDVQTNIYISCDTFRTVFQKQRKLGWSAFIEGLLVHDWVTHVSTFISNKQSPHKWLQQLILAMWDVIWSMWNHRCKLLHTNDLSNKLHDMIQIDNRIKEVLIMTLTDLRPHEKLLFRQSPESISLHTPRYRRFWLQRAEKIITTYKERLRNPAFYSNERRVMFRWLDCPGSSHVTNHPQRRYIKHTSSTIQTRLDLWRINNDENIS